MRTWLAWLSVPAFLIGVVAYPFVQLAGMGTGVASLLIAIGAGAALVAGRPKMLILVVLATAYLPAATAGFVGGALALLLLAMLCGASRIAIPLTGAELPLLAALGWACMAWLVNLGQQTDVWSLPVAVLMFWTPWLIVFLLRAEHWSSAELGTVLAAWVALIIVQLVPAFIKPLVEGHPAAYFVPLVGLRLVGIPVPSEPEASQLGDFTTGTTISAHQLGIAALLGVVYLLAVYWRTRRVQLLVMSLVLGFLVLMTDAKHAVLAAMIALAPAFGLIVWPELGRRVRAAVILLVIAGALALGLVAGTTVVRLSRSGLWEPLIVLTSLSPKIQLYARTAAQMDVRELHTWVGYGPGAFASRAASSRATEALFKEETKLPGFIPPFTPPAYGATVSGLYTASIQATQQNRSDVLTAPFSSLVGIVAEYGILGTLVIAWFLWALVRTGLRSWRATDLGVAWRAAGATLAFAVLLLVVLSAFDSYFEQPAVVIPIATLWLVASVALRRRGAQPA
jgi:hypothetical protein